MTPNRKSLAVARPIYGGAATVYILPFRNVATTTYEKQLDAIDPHYRYVHRETGEERTVEPAEHTVAVSKRQESPWAVTDLWSVTHNNFVEVDPLIVDIEFAPFTDTTSVDLQALALYWQNTPRGIAERWEAWQMLISIEASNILVDEYLAVRSTAYSASKAMAKPAEDSSPQS